MPESHILHLTDEQARRLVACGMIGACVLADPLAVIFLRAQKYPTDVSLAMLLGIPRSQLDERIRSLSREHQFGSLIRNATREVIELLGPLSNQLDLF